MAADLHRRRAMPDFAELFTTDPITYDLQDIGRDHTGSPRYFDTERTAAFINSGAVQESVRNGDFVGYFEHWPRQQYGWTPPSYVRDGNEMVPLAPAVRTSFLHAAPDGTLTHRQTFLDTKAGRACRALYESKQGGFSTVFKSRMTPRGHVPESYHGLDYTVRPNNHNNRPFAPASPLLDSLDPEAAAAYFASLPPEQAEQIFMVLDSLHADSFAMAVAVGERLDAARKSHQPFIERIETLAADKGRLESQIELLRTGAAPFSAREFMAAGGELLDSLGTDLTGMRTEWDNWKQGKSGTAARVVVAQDILDSLPPEPVPPPSRPVQVRGHGIGMGRILPTPAP